MSLRLNTVIMAHPERSDSAEALAAKLHLPIVYDPEPRAERNPWRCARLAWQTVSQTKASHVMVLQEDVLCRKDLLHHVRRALRAKPDRITSLFLGFQPAVTAQQMLIASGRCAAWVQGHHASFVPTVALAMPTDLARSLVEYEDTIRPVADDDVVGRWTRHHGLPWYCTIPSLCNHDDEAPSLMSTEQRNRGAACYVGAADPALIEWDRD